MQSASFVVPPEAYELHFVLTVDGREWDNNAGRRDSGGGLGVVSPPPSWLSEAEPWDRSGCSVIAASGACAEALGTERLKTDVPPFLHAGADFYVRVKSPTAELRRSPEEQLAAAQAAAEGAVDEVRVPWLATAVLCPSSPLSRQGQPSARPQQAAATRCALPWAGSLACDPRTHSPTP